SHSAPDYQEQNGCCSFIIRKNRFSVNGPSSDIRSFLRPGFCMTTTSQPPQHDLSSLRIEDRSRRKGKSGRRFGLFAATLGGLVVLAGLFLAFRGQTPVVEVAAARPAGDERAVALLNASAYVTPRRRATVAAKVTGRVEQIYAEEGLQVK